MTREKRVKALYTLIKLANRGKDLQDYKLANLTFGLATIYLENFEVRYENADNPLSVYYDVITVFLADRSLSIPAPLLSKDTLAECLKRSTIIELPEHNRQFRQWCFDFLTEAPLADEKTQEQGLRPHRIIEKKCSIS